MRLRARSAGFANIPRDRRVVLDHAQLRGEDFSGRDLVQFATVGCRLEACRFEKSRIEAAQFGSGSETSEFLDCSFDGAHLEMGAGGYARFIRCSFRNTNIRHWICFAVELIECTFSGTLQSSIFNGAVRESDREPLDRERNEFRGNDFSAMNLTDVAFRTGVDLSLQRLPAGPEYLYLLHAADVLSRARSVLATAEDIERPALMLIEILNKDVEDGQRQLLLRPNDYYGLRRLPHEAVDKVFSLLRDMAA